MAIVSNAPDAVESGVQDDIGLVIMDINLRDTQGDISGIHAAEEIRKHSQVPIIFLTAMSQRETMERAAQVENSFFLTKPFRDLEFLSRLQKIFASGVMRLDDEFSFDTAQDILTRDHRPIPLNPPSSSNSSNSLQRTKTNSSPTRS